MHAFVFPVIFALFVCFPLFSGPSAYSQQSAEDDGVQDAPIDFGSQIQPILQRNCYGCHGPARQSGDLRLDSKAYVDKGGHTGIAIIGDTIAESELYRRITSDEVGYRMPKDAEPLPPREIALIEKWIEQGALWTDIPTPRKFEPDFNFWIWLDGIITRFESVYEHVRPLKYPAFILLLTILFIERAKVFHGRGYRFTTGRAAPIMRCLQRVRPSYYLIAILGLVLSGLWMFHQSRLEESRQTITRLKADIARITSPAPTQKGSNNGPQPIRPSHPRQLQGTYYRGNDERSDRLFNGGFYRTATFRVWLCKDDKVPLNHSDPLCEEPIFLAFEMQKADQATKSLFSQQIVDSTFLSTQTPQPVEGQQLDTPVPLEEIDEGERWVAYYPIGSLDDKQPSRDGIVYVYQGQVVDGRVTGTIHYGIGYDLTVNAGQLNEDSEIWMGCVLVLSNMVVPPEGKIPIHEWFDFRPIPEIVGPHTDDPELLGIPEHIPAGSDPPGTTEQEH